MICSALNQGEPMSSSSSSSSTDNYAITRDVNAPFDEVVERVTAAMATEGFGVLTTIDVQTTLKKKLDLDVEPYVILGTCNPNLASQGIAAEPDLGVLLPCNVVVRRQGEVTHVAAMDPSSALRLAENSDLQPLADEARERIARAVEAL
jgi:uncharacterized protein (DUF302 family)